MFVGSVVAVGIGLAVPTLGGKWLIAGGAGIALVAIAFLASIVTLTYTLLVSYVVAFTLYLPSVGGNHFPLRADDIIAMLLAMRLAAEALKGGISVPGVFKLYWQASLLLIALEGASLLGWELAGHPDFSRNVYYWLKTIEYFLPVVAIIGVPSVRRRWNECVSAVAVGAVIVVIYGVGQWLGLVPPRYRLGLDAHLDQTHVVGITSTLAPQHAVIGAYVILVVPLLWLTRRRDSSRRARRLWGLVTLGLVLLLYLSECRSAWAGAVAAAAIYLVAAQRRRGIGRTGGIIFAALSIVTTSLIGGEVYTRLFRAVDPAPIAYAVSYATSASTRDIIWHQSLGILLQPGWPLITGLGWGVFPGIMTPEGIASGAHNGFLMLLVELGVPGLGVLTLIGVGFVRIARAGLRSASPAAQKLGLAGVCVMGGLGVFAVTVDAFFPAIGLENMLGLMTSVLSLYLVGIYRAIEASNG